MANEILFKNQYLVDSSKKFKLLLDSNCNIVLQDWSRSDRIHWQSRTSLSTCFLFMQLDCNLVLYDGNGNPKWASGTYEKNDGKPCYVTLQDDRNFVLYSVDTRRPFWHSNTCHNCR